MDKGFLIAAVVIQIMANVAFMIKLNNTKLQYSQIISQCETALPRDQHCKIIAVPEDTP